jgi:hypothetical protein
MAYDVDMSNFPAKFLKDFNKLTTAQKQAWKDTRYRALTDELFFSTEVMGMDFQVNPHSLLFQKLIKKKPGTPLYDLDLKKKKRMILWPRGLFKTSSIIVEICHLIVNYPNIRIAFLTGGDMLAKRQLARVKKVFEQPTKMFEQLFPEFCGKKLGNMSSFSVPCQSASRTYAEPTMAITTARSVKAGSHYDVIFVDDLVNETNYRSIKSLEKCMQDYRDICPLLAPDGFMYITGTRYSFGDTYEEIQELAKKETEQLGSNPWIFSIKSCWTKICSCGHNDAFHDFDSDPDGPCGGGILDGTLCSCKRFIDSKATGLLFPKFRTKSGDSEGHSIEKLNSEKLQLGAEFFSCQYENNPLAEGEQTFTEELIGKQTVWHQAQFPTALQAPCFFMCDLSYTGNDKRDVSVFYCVRHWMGKLYVVDCHSGKWDAAAVVEEMYRFALKHRPVLIWVEQFNGWDAYNNLFITFARDKNITPLPIEWKKMSQGEGAKKVRIGAIKGVLAQGRLVLYGHMPDYEALCTQLKRWPKLGKHDDFADCLGLVCECPTGMVSQALAPAEDISSMSFIRNLHREPEEAYDTRIPGTY